MQGKLIVVGTPIGNLSDFSPRAVETLKNVDFIAAEDTRVTIKLLNLFNIKKALISYHEHNKTQKNELICEKILSGETCALVSDAGMPAISDPGEELVGLCYQKNITVSVVPGPSALTAALAISGLPTGRFTFEGFLSVNKKSRKKHLEEILEETRTMIFYEAPHKLKNTLADLLASLGNRKISIVREITKIHEEVIRTTLENALKMVNEIPVKGEIVLIIDGKKQERTEAISLDEAKEIALKKISEGLSLTEAAKHAAKITGLKKGEIYKLLLK